MEKFTTLTGVAAALPTPNINSDTILPKSFCQGVERTGLSKGLFYHLAHDEMGNKLDTFVLNRAPYCRASILVVGENFGCGSAHEHAVWALLEFGIRAIVAPSFADIFYNNCFKNGILPITLDAAQIRGLNGAVLPHASVMTVDLTTMRITSAKRDPIPFTVPPTRRRQLMDGLDEIGKTMQHIELIERFEQNNFALNPISLSLLD